MADHSNAASCIVLTADIVSAYVSNNTVSSGEISALISQVYSALMRVSISAAVAAPAEPLQPAVPIKRSITPEYLVCLEANIAKFFGPADKLSLPAFPLFSGYRFVGDVIDFARYQLKSCSGGFFGWPPRHGQSAPPAKVASEKLFNQRMSER
jgi:ROS/MUCR transcriptional regulator protein